MRIDVEGLVNRIVADAGLPLDQSLARQGLGLSVAAFVFVEGIAPNTAVAVAAQPYRTLRSLGQAGKGQRVASKTTASRKFK
ncbi:MAG: hypothetical protein ACYST5_21135 [Planctomycetota bacterium]